MIWIILVLFQFLVINAEYTYDESVKVKHLIRSRNIDPDVLPVPPNGSTPFNVSAFFIINGLVDVDAHEETMRLTVSFALLWNDYNLRWTSKDSKSTWVNVPAKDVWYPTLLLSNSFGQQTYVRPDPRFDKFYIDRTGNVIARMYQTFDINCDSDVFKFPRDTMTCKLTFMSSLVSSELAIIPYKTMKSDMIAFDNDDHEWYMSDVTFKSGVEKVSVLNSTFTYSAVKAEIRVIRSVGYYLVVIQLPILMMSSLIALSSFISVDDGERLGFVTELCLTYIVFLVLLDSILPKSSLPLLSVCVIICFFLSVINVIESVVIREFKALSERQSENSIAYESIELQNKYRKNLEHLEIKRTGRRPWKLYARRLDVVMLCINVLFVIVIIILNIGVVYA